MHSLSKLVGLSKRQQPDCDVGIFCPPVSGLRFVFRILIKGLKSSG